jgi:integrase
LKGYFRKRGVNWSFTVDVGTDPVTGKRKQISRSGFKTKKEAQVVCAELITDYEKGNIIPTNEKETVGTFIVNFLENTIKNEVSESTYRSQKGYTENHIIPFLGKIKLQKLTAIEIQKFYSHLIEQGLSPGTVHNIGNFLGKTLRIASEWGLINRNVAAVVKKPTYKQPKMKVWTQDEVDRFLDKTRTSRFHAAYVIALTTGMRFGEICALNWDDVDLKNRLIHVNKTVVYASKKIYIQESTKTGLSRSIAIPEFVVNYLKKYKLEQQPNVLNLIIAGVKNEIVYNSAFSKTFQTDIKKADVPRIRIHDMRHTHASLLLQSGENIKVVSERLGHAKVTTTLNTYAHVLPNMQQTLADNLERSFKIKL